MIKNAKVWQKMQAIVTVAVFTLVPCTEAILIKIH
jgi:hypothetical protein